MVLTKEEYDAQSEYRKKRGEEEDKFEKKFRSIIAESINLEEFMIDDPEDDIGNFSVKALKMLERIWECMIDEKTDLFNLCYKKLNVEVDKTILLQEELETKLRRSQLKDFDSEENEE